MQDALAKIALCRTRALGSHRYFCSNCQVSTVVYNSCGASECPQCSGGKRTAWTESASSLLLDGVTCFQVVFTMPDRLSALALGNRREMCNLLFRSAWEALREVITNEQGFEPAAQMVLHTWNQWLESHFHVHAVVPGGGPALSGQRRWIHSQKPGAKPRRATKRPKPYLVNANTLRTVYRKTFLAGLVKLHAAGDLKLEGDEWGHLQNVAAFESFLEPLFQKEWVVFIQRPPTTQNGQPSQPDSVVKYLARYLTGGPISERRLVSHERGQVTFLARSGNETGGSQQQVPVTLSGVEFVRRWCLHIPPKHFVKTRRFGGYSNYHRERYLAECRDLLGMTKSVEPTTTDITPQKPNETTPDEQDARAPECSLCGKRMECVSRESRPSWRDIMSSSFRPRWYDDG